MLFADLLSLHFVTFFMTKKKKKKKKKKERKTVWPSGYFLVLYFCDAF